MMMMNPNEKKPNKTMFAKFQQHNHQQYHHQVHQHLSQEHQIQLEEDDDDDESRSTSIGGAAGAQGTTHKISKKEPDEINIAATSSGGGDGGTIEVVKRPRGRPPGSRNKPRPQPLFLSNPRDTNYSSMMQPLILEVPSGGDIVESIARYVRRRNIGVCILTASGTVSNVSFNESSTTLGTNVVTFHGSFDILSVSATFHPSPSTSSPSLQSSLATKTTPFSITLAGSHGQIIGGSVVGPLLAATTVTLITASFTTPSYHRLPIEEDKVEVPAPSSVMSDRSVLHQHHPEASRTASEESHPPPTESQDMSIHNWHLPSGVIWAPTAKLPLSPPQPPRF